MIRPGGAFATVSEVAPFPDVACGKGRMPLVRPQPANPRIVVSRRVNLGGVRSTPGSNSLPSICSMSLPGATPVSSIICSIHASVRGERV